MATSRSSLHRNPRPIIAHDRRQIDVHHRSRGRIGDAVLRKPGQCHIPRVAGFTYLLRGGAYATEEHGDPFLSVEVQIAYVHDFLTDWRELCANGYRSENIAACDCYADGSRKTSIHSHCIHVKLLDPDVSAWIGCYSSWNDETVCCAR